MYLEQDTDTIHDLLSLAGTSLPSLIARMLTLEHWLLYSDHIPHKNKPFLERKNILHEFPLVTAVSQSLYGSDH